MKKHIALFGIFVLIASFTLVGAPTSAKAESSFNGYWHSGGKSENSFKWEKKEEKKDKKYENWNWKGNQYQYKQNFDLEYLQAYINHLIALLAAYHGGVNSNVSDIDVRTQSATDITEDSATLRAIVNFDDDEDEAELYFEYGTTYGNLNEKTDRILLDDEEDGDTLEEEVDDLEDDTKYFFRAVGVDEDGEKDYGTILSFFTDEDENDDDDNSDDEDRPEVMTSSATSIDTDSADLRGTVDMNDFENGIAFFVYGEDEDQVDDVEDDFDSYDDVDTDGDDLRKSQVDSDVDDVETYAHNVADLDSNTDIYFTLCVAYDEDEDDDDTEERLECGTTRSFETD